MAEIGARDGVFEPRGSRIIANLLQFNTIRAKDVMTPRTVVQVAAEGMKIKAFFEANEELRFSRIPLYRNDSRDDITGYILKDELLAKLVKDGGDALVGTIKREIIVVHETFPIPELFNRFLEEKEHIALVVGDFGGMSGIVTMEDVIETLLGMEIVDELDHTEDMQLLARRNWEKRARQLGLIGELPAAAETGCVNGKPIAHPRQP